MTTTLSSKTTLAPIEAELRKGGVDHLLIRTDQPFVHRLRHFFRSRGLSKGAR